MNKDTQKYKPYDANRAMSVKWVARKYNVTEVYVRQCDNHPDKTGSPLADEIRKSLRAKYAELKEILS